MIQNNRGVENKAGPKKTFERGSALSIFSSDRCEDVVALILSMLVALGVYLFV